MTTTVVPPKAQKTPFYLSLLRPLSSPLLALFTALWMGAIVMMLPAVFAFFITGFSFERAAQQFFNPLQAYGWLFKGAFGNWDDWFSGNFTALNQTLSLTTPYIFSTLAVAFCFKAALFNIGAEGQLKIGAVSAAAMGIIVGGSPVFIALPLTLAAGILGGALWGAIPGALKALTGAHEVITTIMLNYLALVIISYLVGPDGPMRGRILGQSIEIGENARISTIFPNLPLHWGFIIALAACFFFYWLLFNTPFGFEIRTVGTNPSAARYAGIKVKRVLIATLGIAGAVAGTAGAFEVMGNPNTFYKYTAPLGSGYGFDSIAIALIARNNPLFVPLAALLFAALRSGASLMQLQTVTTYVDEAGRTITRQLPIELISIIQGLIVLFMAAEQVLRWLYRMRTDRDATTTTFSRGWGKME
jgi:general nucleoside transport system permease protein